MAITITNSDPRGRTDVAGSSRRFSGVITLDTYATGGYAIAAADFGLTQIDHVQVSGTTLLGNLAVYVTSTGKIKVYCPVTGVEAANSLNLTADKVAITVWGQ